MKADRSYERASAEDIYFGQVVANWARWAIIGAALMLVLWTSTDTFRLMLGVLPVVGLMVVNFYLHGRYLAGRPANGTLVAIASAIDIALITGLILLWTSTSSLGGGLFWWRLRSSCARVSASRSPWPCLESMRWLRSCPTRSSCPAWP